MLNFMGIVALGAWIAAQIYPPARVVRLRNALLARRNAISDFEWKPESVPAAFLQESAAPYPRFSAAVKQLDLNSCSGDWDRALRIAEHLAVHAQDLGPIQSDLETTYARIRAGYGYCADFVKVFLGLAHAAGLCARQWSFSFDGFGGHGHTVVEVFDRASGKWLFLDVYNNFHVRDAMTAAPLGALEFREALLRGAPAFNVVSNGAGRLGYPIEEKLLAYFRRGLHEWYLIGGNAVFTYETYPLVRWTSRLSGSLGQVVAACIGVHPSIQLLATPENSASVTDLMALGRRFRWVAAVFAVLLAMLVGQVSVFGMVSR